MIYIMAAVALVAALAFPAAVAFVILDQLALG